MNVSATSGASAALMLQKLFQSSGDDTSTSAASGAERQNLPGANGQTCNAGGSGSAQMSGGTMTVMISMQMQAPPSASDIASNLVSGLDTDGDGKVSAEEINAAFQQAGLSTDKVDDAVKALDTDGDGKLSSDELSKAVESDMKAHHGHHHHHAHGGGKPPEASDVASSLLSSFDTDKDNGLSLSEITSALGKNSSEDDAFSQLFASLDQDGNGVLNADELTNAIQQRMSQGYQAYAQAAQAAA
ncbi:MAG TPA: EF-hand domain-containing protein [Hyphomonadaceae bacterium]|nr:EF-hand domain-containing protein [Hyphomonadaceae bacterium]